MREYNLGLDIGTNSVGWAVVDENNQIVCTDANADLIIDIIREVYSKQLFTEEIIETKGV